MAQEQTPGVLGCNERLDAGEAWSLHCGSYEPADQCRVLGVAVGDTIECREEAPGGYWSEARLTLLWLGASVAVWSATERSNGQPEWSEPEESADWALECREWRKVPSNAEVSRAGTASAALPGCAEPAGKQKD